MASKSVVRAKNPPIPEKALVESQAPTGNPPDIPADQVRLTAARLYGQGFRRPQIARALVDYLCPNSKARTQEQKLATARLKLKRWEMSQNFRDEVYQHAIIALDMSTPAILAGVGRKAKRGRVDAARLALELTGRHTPRGDQVVANVTVQIANIPRPEGDH